MNLSNEDVEVLVKKQRDFFASGKTKNVDFRIRQLEKLKNVIEGNENKILDALKKDLNKSTFDGYTTEVGFVMNDIEHMIKHVRKYAVPKKVRTPLIYFGGSSYIMPEPYGEVLIIGPWNYPFQLIISPLVGAMAAGNCAILKTSEYAPNVSRVIEEIINSNFDEEYIKAVEGGVKNSTVLLQHKFDYIFFTGGTTVGRIVMEAASKYLTPITLELGGKSPCIIDKDTNVEYAAKRIAWGKYLNAGQTCVAPDYVMVHKDVKDQFISAMKKTIAEYYGQDSKKSNDYARIINAKHFDRLSKLLEQGKVIIGGKTARDELYIEPTVMTDVELDKSIMQDEIFGPILPVLEYDELEKVITFVNSRSKPLALYFFSKDKVKIDKILNDTSSGGVCINDTISHMTTAYLPFGGVGESGMGNYHGKASFDTFSHLKSVLKNQISFDMKAKYPPYNMSLTKIKKLMKLLK